MLRNLDPKLYDITVIQEPTINYINLTISNPQWNVLYPVTRNTENAKCTCSAILINKLISKDNWQLIPINSPDITAIELRGVFGKIHIYNVYNPGDHNNTLTTLDQHLSHDNSQEVNFNADGILLMGNFN